VTRRAWRLAPAAVVTAGVLLSGPVAAQSPAPGGAGLLGATTEVWRDDFSTLTTWEIIADDTGSTTWDADLGALMISVTADRASVWDDHVLAAAAPVLRVEATLVVAGSGAAGVACGSSVGLQRYLWAGIDPGLGWVFGRIIDARLQVLQRGELPPELAERDGRVTLALECAVDAAGGGDVAVVTADGIPLTTAFDIPIGPFDKATLVVSADAAPVDAVFDDVIVRAGDAYVEPTPGSLPGPGLD